MRYIRDYWHYSDPETFPPFAICTEKDSDSKRRPVMHITSVIYWEDEGGRQCSKLLNESCEEFFNVELYAIDSGRRARELGIMLEGIEYDRLINHILDILNDRRAPKESEVIDYG